MFKCFLLKNKMVTSISCNWHKKKHNYMSTATTSTTRGRYFRIVWYCLVGCWLSCLKKLYVPYMAVPPSQPGSTTTTTSSITNTTTVNTAIIPKYHSHHHYRFCYHYDWIRVALYIPPPLLQLLHLSLQFPLALLLIQYYPCYYHHSVAK